MYDFKMPKLGADMDEGTLIEWKVAVGDSVETGAIVAEVETSKGMIDIEVFVSGSIDTLIAKPGDVIPVGQLLAKLQTSDDRDFSDESSAAVTTAPATTATTPIPKVDFAPKTSASPTRGPANRQEVSPRARRLAQRLNVDLAKITGSGPNGSIVAQDIEQMASSKKAPPVDKKAAMRNAIAAAMSRAKREIPHYYLSHDIDVSELLTSIESYNERLGVTDRLLPALLFYKAIAISASEFPAINGTYDEAQFTTSQTVNLGVAISLRGGGLMAPCLMDAANKPSAELMRELKDLVKRTRSGGLRSSELSGGTITVSNLGDRGVDRLAAVIYPPQVALVGIGSVRQRPWVVDGNIQPRSIANFSLAADHRVSDGHKGALFLRRIEELLSTPDQLI